MICHFAFITDLIPNVQSVRRLSYDQWVQRLKWCLQKAGILWLAQKYSSGPE